MRRWMERIVLTMVKRGACSMKIWPVLFSLVVMILLCSCQYVAQAEKKAQRINRYEVAALQLAKENRELQAKIEQMEFQIQELKTANSFLALQNKQMEKTATKIKRPSRAIASVAAAEVNSTDDLVQMKVYKWKPEQLQATAMQEFDNEQYEKAAQFFQAFLENYPQHKIIDDSFLFQAGLAAYESNKHDDWALRDMQTLQKKFPQSQFYRGAKMWTALIYLRAGEKDKFFKIVEEFRKKYRNTSEWKILSKHYEQIVQQYK